jgi:hypothetical protein
MDFMKLFYWIAVADNARTFFGWAIAIFMIIFVVAIIAHIAIAFTEYYGETKDEDMKKDLKIARNYMFRTAPFLVLFWMLYVFTPTKRDAILIVGGGTTLNYLTTDSTARQIPHELTDYVVTEIRNLAKESEVELNVKTTKERIIEEAKDLSTEELLEKMKKDSNFKDILLNEITN